MTEPPLPPAAPVGRRTGRVLVVDDIAANRLLLRELLEPGGHEVIEADNGIAALELAVAQPPDVVLLDVQMPGLDGFEVCRRLKANEATAAIPVVLVTVLDARADRITGIRAGASDFLTKPVDRTELVLRVGNAIAAYSLYRTAHDQFRRLQELEAMRDMLVHSVVHDLRSPLAGVMVGLELAQMRVSASDAALREVLGAALQSTHRMADMVSDMLDLSRLEENAFPLERERIDLHELITTAARLVPNGEERVVHGGRTAAAPAYGDHKLVLRVIANLLDNALKFTPADGRVCVTATSDGRSARVSVSDTGPGIPPDARSVIFEKFGQVRGVRQPQRSSGLGLAFCKLAVQAHGGEIGVESDGTSGSEFWFSLPAEG